MTTPTFIAGKYYSVKEKTEFFEALCLFVESEFSPRKFTEKLYDRLMNCFGHIAHYDKGGFGEVWFSTPEKQLEWIQHVFAYEPCSADRADTTMCDVELAFQDWLGEKVDFRTAFGKRVADALEASERAEYERLKAKFDGVAHHKYPESESEGKREVEDALAFASILVGPAAPQLREEDREEDDDPLPSLDEPEVLEPWME